MNFLVLLGAVGVTLIIVRSTLLAPIRKVWPSLLGCAQCSGFWVGLGIGVAPAHTPSVQNAISWVLMGGATSAAATLLDFTLAWLDSQTVAVEDDSKTGK